MAGPCPLLAPPETPLAAHRTGPLAAALGDAVRKYRAYWFAPGCEVSHAACRVALALAFLYIAQNCYDDFPRFVADHPAGQYDPVGVLALVSPTPPDGDVGNLLRRVALVSSVTLAVGLCTRLSLLVCVTANLLLCSLMYSYSPSWSHQHSPVLLPALVFLFGPPSAWSVDALLRRLRPPADGARASVMAGQLMLALVFAGAALFKLYLGNGQFGAWCFSDNLRNVLLLQYWVLDQPMPPALHWVIEREWAYKGMAVLNLTAQLAPLLACVLVRWPLLRLACGALFSVEVLGLGFVMGIWNPHWLLLMAFFIDWDWLARFVRLAPRTAPLAVAWRPAWTWQALWGATLIAGQLYVGLRHDEQRRWTFPLTAFPMYSNVYALPPYDQHLAYPLFGSTWTVETNDPLTPDEYRHYIWTSNYSLPWIVPDLDNLAMQVKANLERKPGRVITALRIEKTVFEIAAFPGDRITPTASALAYDYRAGKRVSFSAAWERVVTGAHALRLRHAGLTDPRFRFGYHRHFGGPILDLAGDYRDGLFVFEHPHPGETFFAVVWVRDPALGDREVLCGGPIVYGK